MTTSDDAQRISFARSLYSPDAINAAIEAFAGLATFSVQLADDAVEVTLSDADADVADVLLDEFCNHALAQSIEFARAESN